MLEPESPTVDGGWNVEIDAELVESIRERAGSPEEVDQWVTEAVESHLGRETDPRPDLSRSEYREWFVHRAIRVRLRGEHRPERGD
jgi:hypothetical protein